MVGPDDGLEATLDACRATDGRGFELAIQPEALGTADAVGAAAGLIDRDGVGARARSRRAAGRRRGVARPVGVPPRLRRGRDDGHRRARRSARLRPRRARRGRRRSCASSRPRRPGMPTSASLRSPRSTRGSSPSMAARCSTRFPRSAPRTPSGERYLPEVLAILRERGLRVATAAAGDPAVVLGVNDRADLAAVRAEAQRRIHERHMLAGVTIVQPSSTTIDVAVEIGEDSVDRTVQPAARDDARRPRRHGRPAQHADRRPGRRPGGACCTRTW